MKNWDGEFGDWRGLDSEGQRPRYEAIAAELLKRAPASVLDVGCGEAVLYDFIVEGHFTRHVRRMRQVYGERLSVLLSCADRKLVGLVELSSIAAGLQTPGRLRAG